MVDTIKQRNENVSHSPNIGWELVNDTNGKGYQNTEKLVVF